MNMDPTLAPGYVPPSNGKEKPAKGHHWAEIQKKRAITVNNNSESEGNGDTSSMSSPPTPPIQYLTSRPQTADSAKSTTHRLSRMANWTGGRPTLSDGEGIGGPADLEEVPIGVKRQALRLKDYAFPEHRLRTVMNGNFTDLNDPNH
jgi:hypothetical protein